MKYEENVWYGWGGGECPVHPESGVEFISVVRGNLWYNIITPASEIDWASVVTFRVVKEHKEPRDFWLGNDLFLGLPDISDKPKPGYLHVREVVDNE